MQLMHTIELEFSRQFQLHVISLFSVKAVYLNEFIFYISTAENFFFLVNHMFDKNLCPSCIIHTAPATPCVHSSPDRRDTERKQL